MRRRSQNGGSTSATSELQLVRKVLLMVVNNIIFLGHICEQRFLVGHSVCIWRRRYIEWQWGFVSGALCKLHKCHQCGVEVDHLALHGLICKKSHGRYPRHATVNDLLKLWLALAKISLLEPTGVAHSDGKRPDGILVLSWKKGQTLVWDATCPDTFAPSHVGIAAREAGLVASEAKKAKPQVQSPLRPGAHRELGSIWAWGHFLLSWSWGAGSGQILPSALLAVSPAGPLCCHPTWKHCGSDRHLSTLDNVFICL